MRCRGHFYDLSASLTLFLSFVPLFQETTPSFFQHIVSRAIAIDLGHAKKKKKKLNKLTGPVVVPHFSGCGDVRVTPAGLIRVDFEDFSLWAGGRTLFLQGCNCVWARSLGESCSWKKYVWEMKPEAKQGESWDVEDPYFWHRTQRSQWEAGRTNLWGSNWGSSGGCIVAVFRGYVRKCPLDDIQKVPISIWCKWQKAQLKLV